MSKIIQLSPDTLTNKMKTYMEEKKIDKEVFTHFHEKGLPCRLPYPLTLSALIDVVERLGIMNEDKVIPGLYKLQNQLCKNIQKIKDS